MVRAGPKSVLTLSRIGAVWPSSHIQKTPYLKSPKKIGDKIFGDFLFEEKGGGARFRPSVVVSPKPEFSKSPKKAKSREK